MTCKDFLRKFLFTHARLTGEDARTNALKWPIYRYRCSESSYKALCHTVKKALPEALRGKPPYGFQACFCLFAAETFRREHSGGPWAWTTVFHPLGIDPPSNIVIGRWVEKGLKEWGRDVQLSAGGHRLFLATIACEGGLPLRLLQREGANLRTFFRKMLEVYHESGPTGRNIEEIAKEQVRFLPKTLRNEEVTRLAARLIESTVEFQEKLGDTADPIASLDEQEPDWRSKLPLRLDDDVAASLFKNLVEESRTLAKAASAKPAWKGLLTETGSGDFSVRKVLEFPDRVNRSDIELWLGSSEYADARVRLQLRTGRGSEPVAVLTRFRTREGEEVYRREWLRRDGVTVKGGGVSEPHEVLLHAGAKSVEIPLRDPDPWGESPWVFAVTARNEGWTWVGEGSVAARSEEVLAVVPKSCVPQPEGDGTCEPRGKLREPERSVFHITGQVGFRAEDGGYFRIQCGAGRETADSPRLAGPQLSGLLNERPIFRGIPRFFENVIAGQRRQVDGEIQWRPVGERADWTTEPHDCVGRVWIRLVEPGTRVERIRRQANVVPSETVVTPKFGTKTAPGEYHIQGLASMAPKVVEPASIGVEPAADETKSIVLRGQPTTTETLLPIKLRVSPPAGTPLVLRLPYPQKGAMFQLEGRGIAIDEMVGVDRLYGLFLILQHPSGAERFILHGELVRSGRTLGESGFIDRLPPLQTGRVETNLGPWVDQVNHLLAKTDDPSAFVRLTVSSQWQEELTRIHVAEYDMAPHPDREGGKVEVTGEDLEKIGDDWHARISVNALPLWDPSQEPRRLRETMSVPACWDVPVDLTPGPWWIIARDGAWARFRPLLWTVAEDTESGELRPFPESLSDAVREPDPQRRAAGVDQVLQRLATEPDNADWDLLMEYVALAIEFSPKTLDPLQRLVRHPETLALALLLADETRFDRLFSFPTQMSFAWGLVPVKCWKNAAETYFGHLRASLADIDAAEEIIFHTFQAFRERASKTRPYFEPLCDWLQEIVFPDRRCENNPLKVFRMLPSFSNDRVAEEIDALQGRHDANEYWPTGTQLIDIADGEKLQERLRFPNITHIQRPVKCAPFVAAFLALKAPSYEIQTPNLVYELRVIRSFDREWFDTAYAIALTEGLANGIDAMRAESE